MYVLGIEKVVISHQTKFDATKRVIALLWGLVSSLVACLISSIVAAHEPVCCNE